MSKTAIAAVHGQTMLFQFNPAGPNIARMKQVHRNRHDQREAAEARRVSRPTPKATLQERGHHAKPWRKMGRGWKRAGDGLNQPWKFILHEVQVDLLQARRRHRSRRR